MSAPLTPGGRYRIARPGRDSERVYVLGRRLEASTREHSFFVKTDSAYRWLGREDLAGATVEPDRRTP